MKRKILAAFILAIVAIGFALVISHFAFREMLGTVEQLSAPNEKLIKLNRAFQDITMLDQHQRAEAIQNPQKPYKYFLDQSSFLHDLIDSLNRLQWDTAQRRRLSTMAEVLDQRNQVFVSYLKVKAELADDKEFSHQLDTLSALLHQNQRSTDSIVTTQRKTITRYIQQDSIQAVAKSKNFLKRLFAKKKDKQAEPVLQEQVDVTVDTLTIAHTAVNTQEIEKLIRDLESDQRAQRKRLQDKELELIHANSLFINQLLNTLHEVEAEELAHMKASNDQAARVVNSGISRMSTVMLSFFLAAALLIYFILLDISKSNYYRKQLEKARDEAENLSKIKQRFLANMSHEIRTPLQSIIGFAEHLKNTPSPDQGAVDAIHSSSEHLLHIVNEVLDYSRISSGNFTLTKENFDLMEIIREVESALRIQSKRKNLDFIVDAGSSARQYLFGDHFRLRQILYNLIGNAIKFTSKGFVKLAVTTEEKENQTVCTFEITDTGIGMTSDEVSRIFNQFEQANKGITKQFGGTGLGLTIVKSLVDVQHGTLELQSEPGKGSTFKVVLTYDKAVEEEQTTEAITEAGASSKKLRILLVDDDAMIVKLCSIILKKNGIEHSTFSDPEEILAINPENSVTHILIDIRMPKMNGVQLCQELRKRFSAETKFIALTAHVLPEERDNLLKKGFDSVLPKPFHEADLLNTLGFRKRRENGREEALPDFESLRKMTLGDEALFQSILNQFSDESREDLKNLKVHSTANNGRSVREIVHKLAGRFGQMGLTDLSLKFHDIEVNLVEGKSPDQLKEAIDSVRIEAENLLRNIRLSQTANIN